MRFTVVTILPELIEPSLTAGVVGRAREAGTITVDTVNPRDFTHDRHRTVDDTPYGGGPGMVMKAEPLLAAIARASQPPPGAVAHDPTTSTGGGTNTVPQAGARGAGAGARSGPGRQTDMGAGSGPGRQTEAGSELPAGDRQPFTGAEPATSMGEGAGAGSPAAARQAAVAGHARSAAVTGAPAQPGQAPSGDDEQTPPAGDVEDADDITTTLRFKRPALAVPADDITTTRPFTRPPRSPADEVAASIARVDSSIDKLEHALDGNLDALVAQDAIEAATEDTSAAAGIGAEIKSGASSSASDAEANAEPPRRAHRILLSPSGKPLTQARVRELAKLPHLVLVCGRYEGIDQRVIDAAIDEEISIGDFVLSGGELGALVIIDAVARYVPGVLGAADSVDEESFSAGLLEYPQYTRPPELAASHVPADRTIERAVPPILQSGNHAAIASWRRKQSIERTASRRPDLFRSFTPTKADAKLVPPLRKRTHLALVHHPVVDRVNTVITTALTNFDIHDLARSTMTFGLAGYHIVTPITSQREKAEHIARLWSEDEQGEHRAAALRLIRTATSVDEVIASITADHGGIAPTVVATSAKSTSFPAALRRTTTELLAETATQPAPVLILLGTGWGLADWLIPSVSRVLAPIEGGSDWNHLSVRSAGAIILDRLFGRPA